MATLSSRVRARVMAGQLDQRIETGGRGAPIPTDSPLALHMARITSRSEREQLAAALLRGPAWTASPCAASRCAATDLIDELTRQLRGPLPVRARGMARLRMLLADRRGPFYRIGPASLTAALRGVLAAL